MRASSDKLASERWTRKAKRDEYRTVKTVQYRESARRSCARRSSVRARGPRASRGTPSWWTRSPALCLNSEHRHTPHVDSEQRKRNHVLQYVGHKLTPPRKSPVITAQTKCIELFNYFEWMGRWAPRCMMRRMCMCSSAEQIWMKYFQMVFSGISRCCFLKCYAHNAPDARSECIRSNKQEIYCTVFTVVQCRNF